MVLFSIFIQQLQLLGLLNWLGQAMQPGLSALGLHPVLGVSAVEGISKWPTDSAEIAKTTAPILAAGRHSADDRYIREPERSGAIQPAC